MEIGRCVWIKGITISGMRMPIVPSSFLKIPFVSFSSPLKFPSSSAFLPSHGHGRLLSTVFQSSTSPLLSELQNDDSFVPGGESLYVFVFVFLVKGLNGNIYLFLW